MTDSLKLKKSALNATHRRLGARMVEFAGWEMPIEYSGIIQEHMAVRTAVGLFDISHMGEVTVNGPESLQLIQKVTCNDASRLKDGQIQYSALLTPQGTFIDDILVHRFSQEHFFICVNASNSLRDFEWIAAHNTFDAKVENVSSAFSQLALQGPFAIQILQQLTSVDLSSIRYYWFDRGKVEGVDTVISRTGYTGEDGFELYFDPQFSELIWNRLVETGGSRGLLPVGLGARNTLRLEAKMALYGHEISEEINPWEAGLEWIVKIDKGEFIGRDALLRQKQENSTRKLIGLEVQGRGIARDGYAILCGGELVGSVTSGGPAPYLKKNIALAYVPPEWSAIGTRLEVQIRSQRVAAVVVDTPFYRRAK